MSTPKSSTASSPVVGTWRLVSWEVKKADGRIYLPFGQDLDGYIGYTAQGRVSVFMRLQLKTVFYAGTYDIEGNEITHHVTVADRLSTEGRDLVRTVLFEGARISLTTIEPPPRTLVENTETGDTSRLVWERVQ